jgi:S1-C subfamily serine protease
LLRHDGVVAINPLTDSPGELPDPAGPAESDAPAPAPVPAPRRRGPGPAVLAAALLVIGGLAGGALGAEVVLSRTPAGAPVAATAQPSALSGATAQAPASATAIYQQAAPGIVTITTEVARAGRVGEGTGSGIVLDRNGNILTNAHVVAGATQVQVRFHDGRTVPATVVNSNTRADLAVLRVTVAAASLHPLTLGNSDSVRVGDTVFAIGAPFGLSESMSAGIVSGLNRSNQASGLTGLIQTDAPINPGNSGGALLNDRGQVVGVNDSIESPVAGNVGVGFAIPINVVKQLLGSLEGGADQ